MKIAIVDMDSLKNPFWGAGQARATREVGKRLASKNSVTVYTSKYPGYKDYFEDGISYKHVGFSVNNPVLSNIAFVLNIPLLVRKVKADVIIENFNAPFSVSFSPLFTSIPVIALPTMFNAVEFSKKYGFPFHWIEKLGMRFYKYMLPYSDVDSTKAKKMNKDIYMKCVSQGVSDEFFKIKKSNPKHILFLGRFDFAQKGIDILIKAYSKVAEQIKYPLVIAGHGPDEKKIRKMINELGLMSKVQLVGPAYGEKKYKLMSEALFVTFPSRHDEMSLWSLEALAAGLPLLCFDIPESKWLTEQVTFKAKPFEVDEYSNLLLKATEGKSIWKMRTKSRKFAKQFSWDKVAFEIENFLIEVIDIEKSKKAAARRFFAWQ